MYPAVPFFNLPKLRRAIEHDLPAALHGLSATWKEMLELRRKFLADPDFKYIRRPLHALKRLLTLQASRTCYPMRF